MGGSVRLSAELVVLYLLLGPLAIACGASLSPEQAAYSDFAATASAQRSLELPRLPEGLISSTAYPTDDGGEDNPDLTLMFEPLLPDQCLTVYPQRNSASDTPFRSADPRPALIRYRRRRLKQETELGSATDQTATGNLTIRLFGSFEVWRGNRFIDCKGWGQRKTQTLLKLLLSERGRLFSTDQLIEGLYPDHDPEKVLHNLTGRISQLRHALEPYLQSGADSQYILRVGKGNYCFSASAPCWLDTEGFQHQVDAGRAAEQAGRWPEALKDYQQALTLYRGDYLAENLYDEWTLAARERWGEAYLIVLERAAECHARLGQYDQALERCGDALKRAPLREGLYRQKMLYHSLAGQPDEALKAYAECVKVLKDELNMAPSPETQRLYEQILQGEHAQEAEYPSHVALPQHNLPCPTTRFIGREREMAEVKQLLAAHRLVTLTGAGGCGKSRLALQVAADLAKTFAHGVWWIALASVNSSSDLVLPTVAAALGVVHQPEVPVVTAISSYLQGRQTLLVLDGCEHAVETCASLVSVLLSTHPSLRILVTSREILGSEGEVVWQVPPLSLPDFGQPAGSAGGGGGQCLIYCSMMPSASSSSVLPWFSPASR